MFSSLKREQKESVGLLSIGTFLEYFDLMLYVHMAVLLNEIFFPKTDPHTASLLAALALCSSLAFRPIGALLFGWIGDRIGRKPTIIITTTMMALSCIVMANLPTYAQIGIAAAWIVTICRIAQGISSMGEIVGARIYLTETIIRPARFPAVAGIEIFGSLGGLAALGVAFLVTSYGMNWRLAFWMGAIIAVVSAFARKRLRETPEFLEAQRKWMKKVVHEENIIADPIGGAAFNATWKEYINKKTLLSYFFISSGQPLSFYLVFFHFIPVLKEFGYSSEDIVKHNFFLAFIPVINDITLAYLSYRIHPLKIQKIRSILGVLLLIALPFLIMAATSPMQLFLIQSLIFTFRLEEAPSIPVFYNHFPVYCRFRSATLLFSLSRAFMTIITSFGMIYLVSYFGSFGIWVITIPIGITFLYSLKHFESLERKMGLYPNLIRSPDFYKRYDDYNNQL
jgi:MFS family permease